MLIMGLLIFWFCLGESWLVAIQWEELVWCGAYQGRAPKSGLSKFIIVHAGIFRGLNKCLIVTFTWTAKKTHGPD